MLALGDIEGMTTGAVRDHMVIRFGISRKEVEKYDILLAYESVGENGCDSCCFYLLESKKTKKLFEVNCSHCSRDDFDWKFVPEETSVQALARRDFFPMGGYDDHATGNRRKIKNFISKMLPIYTPLSEAETPFSKEQLRELLGTRLSGFIVENPKDFSTVTVSLSNEKYDFSVDIVIKKIVKHDTEARFFLRVNESGEVTK